MLEIFSQDFMVRALIGSVLLSITAPILGMFVVSRRISLVGDTLSHLAFAGIAIGVFLDFFPLLTTITFSIIASLLLLKLMQSNTLNSDAVLAVFFSSSMAIGTVLLSMSQEMININEILFGSLLWITNTDLIYQFIVAITIITVTTFSYKKWFILSIDQDLSRINNTNVNFYDNLLIVLTSILIVVSVRMVGVLLISSLLVLPILIALQLTNNFRNTIFIGIGISLLCSLSGVTSSYYLSSHPSIIPPSGLIVIILSALFTIILIKNNLKIDNKFESNF
jgi:zinc transport system permease protein|tara:strand:- start:3196 stop:4035 length:840 start_codon:yes stop_codon:yes gene_type:complete